MMFSGLLERSGRPNGPREVNLDVLANLVAEQYERTKKRLVNPVDLASKLVEQGLNPAGVRLQLEVKRLNGPIEVLNLSDGDHPREIFLDVQKVEQVVLLGRPGFATRIAPAGNKNYDYGVPAADPSDIEHSFLLAALHIFKPTVNFVAIESCFEIILPDFEELLLSQLEV